jgi:hypothetical protein
MSSPNMKSRQLSDPSVVALRHSSRTQKMGSSPSWSAMRPPFSLPCFPAAALEGSKSPSCLSTLARPPLMGPPCSGRACRAASHVRRCTRCCSAAGTARALEPWGPAPADPPSRPRATRPAACSCSCAAVIEGAEGVCVTIHSNASQTAKAIPSQQREDSLKAGCHGAGRVEGGCRSDETGGLGRWIRS